ncbi:glycine rich domain-containing protein [Clostridioides difficile]|uniref:glycine rich domain-containing protein n=1 Tax=Clostridioides difficile TaxID=1496 RepID=UPI00097FEC4D|nr:glycine rich domain-containing protein [Clostridioides difficile]SJR68324.1 Glycine rich protein [Clostridioides difficile]SJS61469.1 Glycine rich protein [Clostridioides difficile]SJS68283.1 Glycine rich protein [Clostridioides difficile]
MQTEWNFDAVSSAQEIILKPGKYKLECWGARGGATGTPLSDGFYYGKGGYSSGELTLKKETTLYIYVGFDGKKGSQFNGAGYCGSATGGGATDIRLVDGNWDNPQGLLSRIIVAGGGGGTRDRYTAGSGGGLKGGIGRDFNGSPSHGGTQFEGGKGKYDDGSLDGSFGKGCAYPNPSAGSGGGGGWFGGAGGNGGSFGSGGGSGYVLTKDSYKPPGYTPTSEYYFDNVVMTTGGNTTVVGNYSDGYAKITLLQALPFLTISSYNSTTATFKADHTNPTLLTKIEYFIDDTLKETITTDLTLEKTINYTLEDNALHTLKIVVTDSANATAEKNVSISKGIAPLPAGSTTDEVTSKWMEIKDTFKSGKTSIINTLALKNIEASLNNTLVELSEKIKASFDSGDASIEDLTNKLTQANNTISQLNSKYKVASGNSVVNSCVNKYGFYHGSDYLFLFPGAIQINGLNFVPNIFFTTFELIDSGYFRKFFVFACRGIFTQDFVITAHYHRLETYLKDFKVEGEVLKLNERDVYMDNRGIQLPCQRQGSSFKWQAIKFI